MENKNKKRNGGNKKQNKKKPKKNLSRGVAARALLACVVRERCPLVSFARVLLQTEPFLMMMLTMAVMVSGDEGADG